MVTIGASLSVHARSFSKPRRRVELANACNGLNTHPRQTYEPPMVNRRRDAELVACHSETRRFPELVESRFSATFVAQVLGQISPAKRVAPGLGARAYARARRDEPAPKVLRVA